MGFISFINRLILIKKGYYFWKHLLPFSIASALLVISIIPSNNLLLKLGDRLKPISWFWLPSIILTLVTGFIYILIIYNQIYRAYPTSKGIWLRLIGTFLISIIFCFSLAYLVLKSAKLEAKTTMEITLGDFWSCLLVALLSLMGIGWSDKPDLVKALGIEFPDYASCRLSINKIVTVLKEVRSLERSEYSHVEAFLGAATELLENFEKQALLEPEWIKPELNKIKEALNDLIAQTKQFQNEAQFSLFAEACRGQLATQYGDFINNLNLLSNYWPEIN